MAARYRGALSSMRLDSIHGVAEADILGMLFQLDITTLPSDA